MKNRLLWLLALLMGSHLAALGAGTAYCLRQTSTEPVCQRYDGVLQQTAETYLAVLLALLANPSEE